MSGCHRVQWSRFRDSRVVKVSDHGRLVMSSSPVPLKTRCVGQRCTLNLSRAQTSSRWLREWTQNACGQHAQLKTTIKGGAIEDIRCKCTTATAGSDVVQSGRPIFDDFFQHLWPYIGNNTANVVFQMVKRLWLIRIDQ
ncbi:hypothetical protein TNCV_5084951 [Trichonephila clavipes]|uniref:Uncharacterized protein n=1 Tax=Trichonephila clavipes TaxID=2585209 RepID=A0A8X6SHY5_TRICX|nr:hypothetical protein TNCV_5084951 [Trichonephila clavipes]